MKHDLRRGTCVRFYRNTDDTNTAQGVITALTFDEHRFPTYTIVSHAADDEGTPHRHIHDGWISLVVDDSTAYDDD